MMRLARRLARWAMLAALAVAAGSVAWALLYRVATPPVTPLMAIRWAADGAGIARDAVPLDAVSPHLVHAVIAAEDSRFCAHDGFDWDAIEAALDANERGGRLRGGSTISMQTAKNAFLWPDRTWVRKGAEAWFTLLIETLWPKRRIIEVYLNIVEWGDGVYGAEAAARHHFGKPASALTRREAALLAVSLPNPRERHAGRPTTSLSRRAAVIEQRMRVVEREGLAGCVGN